VLDGTNFLLWARAVQVALGGREKANYLIDAVPDPATPHLKKWKAENLCVMS
jgi:hypothetical protein